MRQGECPQFSSWSGYISYSFLQYATFVESLCLRMSMIEKFKAFVPVLELTSETSGIHTIFVMLLRTFPALGQKYQFSAVSERS